VVFRIAATALAARQIRNESEWWRRNRTKAPNLFRDELRRAFALIADYPEAGALTDDVDLIGLRRVLLVSTQHHIYYRVNTAAKRIEILAVWSTMRGEPPPIPLG
jgi:plasmid stabilization system protein ParE